MGLPSPAGLRRARRDAHPHPSRRSDETVLTTQGRPLSPDDQIRVVDADGKELPDGEPGELLARGPYTARGYYRAPGLNARSFTPDGYLRTGVLARRTPAGNLVVAGRLEGAAHPLHLG
ncbi:AMP-binding protein [Streptomyces sp. DSM 116496]|uniref:AMP-binding protein n=1 Tax=Streptomyces stoeckheimensis TaxID=3344656 RepID=UPI0038B299BB